MHENYDLMFEYQGNFKDNEKHGNGRIMDYLQQENFIGEFRLNKK